MEKPKISNVNLANSFNEDVFKKFYTPENIYFKILKLLGYQMETNSR